MSMMKRVIPLLAASLLVAAQAADAVTWQRVAEPLTVSQDKKFSVELPIGWVQAIDEENEVVATRDGLGLQFVKTMRTLHAMAFQELETKAQKKANALKLPKDRTLMVSADMLPAELAELVIAEMKSGAEMSHVQVVSNLPCEIDGHQGFRIHFQYRNPKGVQFDHVICGFVGEKNLYRMIYRAPSKIYFQRDLEAFNKMVTSFKLSNGKES